MEDRVRREEDGVENEEVGRVREERKTGWETYT